YEGLSYRIGIPVASPGSLVRVGTPKYRLDMELMVGVSGGTTDPRMMARICTRSIRLCANNPPTSSPSSSDVRSRSVWSRQLWMRVAPSNTPSTILVLPTSIARSIYNAQVTVGAAREPPRHHVPIAIHP